MKINTRNLGDKVVWLESHFCRWMADGNEENIRIGLIDLNFGNYKLVQSDFAIQQRKRQ